MKKYLQINYYKSLLAKVAGSPALLIILLSLTITIAISAIVGVGGYLLLTNFWGTFIITFGLQFIVFAIVNGYLQ